VGSQPANTTLKICNLGTIAGRSLPRKMGTVGRGWIRRGVLKMSEHIILSPSERNIYNLQVSGNTTTTGWKRYYLIDTSASVHITLYHTHTHSPIEDPLINHGLILNLFIVGGWDTRRTTAASTPAWSCHLSGRFPDVWILYMSGLMVPDRN